MRNAGTAQQIEIGWWPGDHRYPGPAFYGFASPAPDGFASGKLAPAAGHWDDALGEFILGWDELLDSKDPHLAAQNSAGPWSPMGARCASGIPTWRPVRRACLRH